MLKYCDRLALFSALLITSFTISAPVGRVLAGTRAKHSLVNQNPSPSPLKPCKIQGIAEELLCGKLSVFENRKSMSGRKIDLNVVVLPALEPQPKEAPLFDLQGGPGIAATEQAKWYTTDLKEYRRHRAIVLVDQRGTGASNPLQCGTKESSKYVPEMYPVKYVDACRRRLEQVADLTQYATPNAMDDLDDVRAWLGYDKINLIGLSYGTRAALVYMRQHAQHVRSAVLMGVAPTYAKLPLYHTRNGQRGMLLLLDECEADAACAKAYPGVRQELAQVLERLARHPARVNYPVPATNTKIAVEIQRDVFAEQLRSQMYEPSSARRLPFIIHRAAEGDFIPFLKIAIAKNSSSDFSLAVGMYLSVTCAEDVPLIDAKEAERINKNTFFGNYRVTQQRRACQYWPRGEVPVGYDKPVDSDIPVLIFSGYMDPVTPPEWGAEVASHLPNSKHVVIRHHAHVPIGLTNIDCLDKVTLEFLERGDVKNLDTTCLDQMLPPPFFVEQPAVHKSGITKQHADELKKVRVNGVELHYLDRGKGIPVIFVHGGLNDYRAWESEMKPFSEAYRVIAYSRRYDYPNNNPLKRMDHSAIVEAEDLAALIKSLKLGRVHIVGASYGAYTGLFLALRHPEMVRTLVLAEAPALKLAENNPQGIAIYEELMTNLWRPAGKAFRSGNKEQALKLTVDYFMGKGAFDQTPEAIRQGLRDNLPEWQALTTSRDAFPVLRHQDLKRIKAPILMLSGERTLNIHRFVDAELHSLLHAERVIIPNASHDMWAEYPQVCRKAALAFIARN